MQQQAPSTGGFRPGDAMGVHDPGAVDANVLRRIEGLGELRQRHADQMLAAEVNVPPGPGLDG